MRWLLVHPGPNFSVADMHTGWAEALRGLGQDVAEYNMDRRLSFFSSALLETGATDEAGNLQVCRAMTRAQAETAAQEGLLGECYAKWPDVVLCTSAFFTAPRTLEIIRSRGHKIVMLFSESPYQDEMQLEMARYATVSLLNDPVNLGRYRENGTAEYMPHAYRPAVHHPGRPDPELACDFAFIGTGYPSRIGFFEAMNLDGLDVLLGGFWKGLAPGSPLRRHVAHDENECLDNEQAADVYRSARAGINFYRREHDAADTPEGWSMGPREVEMAACGLFFLRDRRGESDEVLGMLPSFGGPGDASEKLRWWLDRPGLRAEAARKAREAVAGRTFDSNARKLLAMLDRQ
jgi:spore maturation protein CgeB